MKKEKSCGTIIIDNNKVLLVEQKKSKTMNFPKGHMIDGETEEETAIRETKEETNLDVIIDSSKRFEISYIQNESVNKIVVYYIAKLNNSSNLKIQKSEISNAKWIDIDKVEDIISYDNLKDLWREVLKKIDII